MRKPISKKIFLWLALTLLGVAYHLYYVYVLRTDYSFWGPLYYFTYLAQPLACFGLGGVLSALFCHFSDARPAPLLRKLLLILSSATVILFLILCLGYVNGLIPGINATWKVASVLIWFTEIPLLFAVPAFLIDLCTSK